MANRDRAAVESGLNDILGNVIRSDAQRAGRGRAEPPPETVPPVPTPDPVPQSASDRSPLPDDTMALTQYDIMTNGQEDKGEEPVPPARPAPSRRPTRAAERRNSRSPLTERIETAQTMAASPTMTVTLRIPMDFNAWLDEYVHLSWPQRIRKQELVVEALRLLYARRGKAGEEVIESDLSGAGEDVPGGS